MYLVHKSRLHSSRYCGVGAPVEPSPMTNTCTVIQLHTSYKLKIAPTAYIYIQDTMTWEQP